MNAPHVRTALLLCAPLLATFAPAGSAPPTRLSPAPSGALGPAASATAPADRETRLSLLTPPAGRAPAAARITAGAPASAAYGRLPLQFEPNVGQTDPRVRFLSHGRGYTLFLTDSQAVLSLTGARAQYPGSAVGGSGLPGDRQSRTENRGSKIEMRLVGAIRHPQSAGLDPLPGKVNYLTGRDPRKWRTNIPTYAKVRCRGVYPGIDLLYYGSQQQLEYDFVVAPGADPERIRLAFSGADGLSVDPAGDLVVRLAGGEVRFRKPHVYQQSGGRRTEIASAWALGGEGFRVQGSGTRGTQHATRNTVRSADRKSKIENRKSATFRLARYDRARPLVIDPVLDYATYLGGGGDETPKAIAVDADRCAYLAGITDGGALPTTEGAFQAAPRGDADSFVAKLSEDGGQLLYCTYFGGTGTDTIHGIAVDRAGRACIGGVTTSLDLPTTTGVLQPAHDPPTEPGENGFVAKLDPNGSGLAYCTYLGRGSGGIAGLAMDASGCAYVTGWTYAKDFPTMPGPATPFRLIAAFVAKVNASGTKLVYSRVVPGAIGRAVAVDPTGCACVAGTAGDDLLTTAGACQGAFGGGDGWGGKGDAWVARIGRSGALLYSTYLGGGDGDGAYTVAVDASGNAFVAGSTERADFPVTAGTLPGTTKPYGSNGWVAKVNAAGSHLLYSTYLGATGEKYPSGIALRPSGSVCLVGHAASTDLPSIPNDAPDAGSGAFVATLNPSGTGYLQAACVSGATPAAVALGPDGCPYVAARATSTFPTTNGAYRTAWGGGTDAAVFKINQEGTDLVYATYVAGDGGYESGAAIAVDASGSAYIAGSTDSLQLSATGGGGQPGRQGASDAFVAKLSPAGDHLLYWTYVGGSADESAGGVALDSAGSAYLVGTTSSADFPVTVGAGQTVLHGGKDAFAARLNPTGSGLLYATLLGGSNDEAGNGIALDASGCAYLVGTTASANFPTTRGAFQTAFAGGSFYRTDMFVAKLSQAGSRLAYSTYLGGSKDEEGSAIAVDADRCAYITGWTGSDDFPTTASAYRLGQGSRVVVAKIASMGSHLIYSAAFGGTDGSHGNAIAVDAAGCAYVTGATDKRGFPTTPGAAQTTAPDGDAAFVTKMSPSGARLLYSTLLTGSEGGGWPEGRSIVVDPQGFAYVAGESAAGDFPVTANAVQFVTGQGYAGFLTQVSPTGGAFTYSTLVGGIGGSLARGVALDVLGRVYVTGRTQSTQLATTLGASHPRYAGGGDVFVVRLAPGGGTTRFTSQPISITAGGALPAVKVTVTDAAGNPPAQPVPVTLTILYRNGAAGRPPVLLGTTRVSTVRGVATFKGLSVTAAGTGYQLVAWAGGCETSCSAAFDVRPAAAVQLGISSSPYDAMVGKQLNVSVYVTDRFNNLCTNTTRLVSLSLASGPAGSTLGGNLTSVTRNGWASFYGLTISLPGEGYVLKASTPGLPEACSRPFPVAAASGSAPPPGAPAGARPPAPGGE